MASLSAADAGGPDGTPDLAGNDPFGIEAENPEHVEARDSFGGSVHRNKSSTTIIAWIAVIALFAAAVAISAVSLQRSSEALDLANSNVKAIEERVVVVPAGAKGQGAEPAPTEPERERTPSPTPEPTTPKPTPTDSPTDPHPLNPKWYQTTHADYQWYIDHNEEQDLDIHSHSITLAFCNKMGGKICPYDVYCPDGRQALPFHGGPPVVHNSDDLRETQWAPYDDPDYKGTTLYAHVNWVQIGKLDKDAGGREDNGFGMCWKYDEFYAGEGVDIEEKWGEEYRMWILCCDVPSEPP